MVAPVCGFDTITSDLELSGIEDPTKTEEKKIINLIGTDDPKISLIQKIFWRVLVSTCVCVGVRLFALSVPASLALIATGFIPLIKMLEINNQLLTNEFLRRESEKMTDQQICEKHAFETIVKKDLLRYRTEGFTIDQKASTYLALKRNFFSL